LTTQNLQTRILFDGGWATDFGSSAPVSVGQDGVIRIPFLAEAENLFYHLDGGSQKIGGTTRINAAALNSGASVRGLTDFWAMGTGASTTQKRVVHVGDALMADSGDGSFSTIKPSGVNATSIPSYAIYDDELIIMSDIGGEVPLKWTGTGNVAALGTNTPDFAFGVTHKNRFFAAGVLASKSRLYYSEPLPNGAGGDWNQVEAGYIDIDPDDGDRITGLVSYKKELWIFKGPNIGSIHRLSGDTPLGGVTAFGSSTQPVPFRLDNFVQGLGAAGHNSIFHFRDDIGFVDAKTGSVRSLKATAAFGDFRETALSFPINNWLMANVNKARLDQAWAVSDVSTGRVLITVPIGSSTTNNTVLSMDHRFETPRWSNWPAINAECMALIIDASLNNRQSVFIGDTDGFVRRTGVPLRSLDETTAINFRLTLPFIDYGNPVAMKTFERGAVGIRPKGDFEGTFRWFRDDSGGQEVDFSQGGGDVLGGVAGDPNVFTLGTSELAGGRFVDKFFSLEEGGEFRSIQYEIVQTEMNQDIEIHNLFTEIALGADSSEN
jgi:hypothetical protein